MTEARHGAHSLALQILMQLNGHATQLIPDNFRANGIQFFQNKPDALHR